FTQTIGQLAMFPDGWYVPVFELLDRMRAVRALSVRCEGNIVELRNDSEIELRELALRAGGEVGIYGPPGELLTQRRNAADQVPVGDLRAGASLRLRFAGPAPAIDVPIQRFPDYTKLVMGTVKRVAWQFQHGRRHGWWGAYRRVPGALPVDSGG